MCAVGSRRRVGRSRSHRYTRNEVCTLRKLKVYVVDVEATLSRSEAGVGLVGTTPSRATSADAFAARG
eukprot:1880587-Pleurochrysis_carterae.AAC.1